MIMEGKPKICKVVGLEDGGRGLRARQYICPLEVGKGKETLFSIVFSRKKPISENTLI